MTDRLRSRSSLRSTASVSVKKYCNKCYSNLAFSCSFLCSGYDKKEEACDCFCLQNYATLFFSEISIRGSLTANFTYRRIYCGLISYSVLPSRRTLFTIHRPRSDWTFAGLIVKWTSYRLSLSSCSSPPPQCIIQVIIHESGNSMTCSLQCK